MKNTKINSSTKVVKKTNQKIVGKKPTKVFITKGSKVSKGTSSKGKY